VAEGMTIDQVEQWLRDNRPNAGAEDAKYDQVLQWYANQKTNPLRSFEKQSANDISIAEMGRNFLPSAERAGVNMLNAVLQPGQSAETMKNLLSVDPAKEPFREQVREHFDQRYGSLDNLANTINTDPVGFGMDASALMAGTGGGLGLVGSATRLGKLASVGRGVQTAGVALDPMNLAINTAKMGGKAIANLPKVRGWPAVWYQWATKMKTTIDPKLRQKAVNLALKEGIDPTPDGVYKIKRKASEVMEQREAIIFDGKNDNIQIPVNDFYKELDDMRKFYVDQPHRYGPKYARLLNKAEKDLRASLNGRESMSLREWQDFRTTIGREADWNVSRQQGTMLDNKIDQAFYHTARKHIQGIDTRIKPLDQKYHDLMMLHDLLTGQNSGNFAAGPAGRIGNRTPLDMKGAVMMGPAIASGNPAAIAGTTAYAIANEPSSLYKAARGLHNLKTANPVDLMTNNSPAWWAGRQGAANVGNMQWYLPQEGSILNPEDLKIRR
jgi:hypothetical protein